jgi:hypothetical protein
MHFQEGDLPSGLHWAVITWWCAILQLGVGGTARPNSDLQKRELSVLTANFQVSASCDSHNIAWNLLLTQNALFCFDRPFLQSVNN